MTSARRLDFANKKQQFFSLQQTIVLQNLSSSAVKVYPQNVESDEKQQAQLTELDIAADTEVDVDTDTDSLDPSSYSSSYGTPANSPTPQPKFCHARLLSPSASPEIKIEFKTMTTKQLNWVLHKWAGEDLHWSPGLNYAPPFHAADSTGYHLLTVNGKPAASLAAVKWENFNFIGLYIVAEEYRGQGLGFQLWKHVSAKLQEEKRDMPTGLNAVLDQVSLYEKSGFQAAQLNVRYQGPLRSILKNSHRSELPHIILKQVDECSFNALLNYDAQIFSCANQTFLAGWTKMAHSYTLVAYDKSQQEICGYGTISPITGGYRIGPLYANQANVAIKLFSGLCLKMSRKKPSKQKQHTRKKCVQIDTTEANPTVHLLVERFGLFRGIETRRMWKNGVLPTPAPQEERMFGLRTLEIG